MLRRYAATWVLVATALSFNVLHYYLEIMLKPLEGTPGYWLNTTVENLQSEVWQIALAAFVFQHWKWWRSPEANEDAPNTGWAIIVPVAVIVGFVLAVIALGPAGRWNL